MSEEAKPKAAEEKKESPKAKKEEKKPASSTKASGKLAAILIRSPNKSDSEKKATLQMLKLYRKNTCGIYDNTPSMKGMIKKIENHIAWGEIDDSTLKELQSKRGEKQKKDGKEVLKPFFRLSPPKGGFERKGTKTPFALGGALGYRGSKINDLIRRML